MRPLSLALLIAALLPACARAPAYRSAERAAPAALLLRAIAASGGEAALARAGTLAWEADAVVHAPGRDIALRGRWAVRPPDSAVVRTWEPARGEASARALVVAGNRGWTTRDGQATPMNEADLAHERGQFYLYSVLRLLPLRDPAVRLTALPPDSLGRPGLRAERAGWPSVDLYFGADGRPARLRNRVSNPAGGAEIVQEMTLAGTVEHGGVRWPREIRLVWDGQPFFDVAITRFETRAALNEPLPGP